MFVINSSQERKKSSERDQEQQEFPSFINISNARILERDNSAFSLSINNT